MAKGSTCPHCGLPYEQCNAYTIAKSAFVQHLRESGYSYQHAEGLRAMLLPDLRRELSRANANEGPKKK